MSYRLATSEVSKVKLEYGGTRLQAVDVLQLVFISVSEVKDPLDFAIAEDGVPWKTQKIELETDTHQQGLQL